jgi:hypothetical protein
MDMDSHRDRRMRHRKGCISRKEIINSIGETGILVPVKTGQWASFFGTFAWTDS